MEAKDAENELLSQLKAVYSQVLELQKSCQMVLSYMKDCDNDIYLHKSFNAGQITLLTYLQEQQYMHEMFVKNIAIERDLELRKAELCIY